LFGFQDLAYHDKSILVCQAFQLCLLYMFTLTDKIKKHYKEPDYACAIRKLY